MLVFWEQRLVFLSTPKTGSTAIESALESLSAIAVTRPPVLKHTTVHRYRRFIGPYLRATSGADFETVALMREPRDWLGSWFRYRTRNSVSAEKGTQGLTFEQFVTAYASEDKPAFADVGSQERFLRPRNGEGIDHLFRYEDIDSFVAFLEDRLDCAITLPRLNVSPPGALDLSPEGEALLQQACVKDYEMYASINSIGAAPSSSDH
ncbi:hypothetical protein [Falsirhodobacter sp. alg1]|uniref:hypothetical protein n=1 Tax=Falsirhodobacter sp. alg1 TaxID=1472418 RepID=UPI000786B3CB|nr:hypothetical protein [Falsirhodobacter sp. alg1]